MYHCSGLSYFTDTGQGQECSKDAHHLIPTTIETEGAAGAYEKAKKRRGSYELAKKVNDNSKSIANQRHSDKE